MFPFPMVILYLAVGLPILVAMTPHIFPMEVYYLMYGNLMNWRKTFLPMDGVGYREGAAPVKPNITIQEALSDQYMLYSPDEVLDVFESKDSGGRDGILYDQLNAQVLNLTRKRFRIQGYSYLGTGDYKYYDASDPGMYEPNHFPEKRKRNIMNGIGLTWLLNARFLMDRAFKQRNLVHHDKMYQLGYLFNRLRRLKTEMMKMVKSGYDGNQEYWNQRVMLTVRIYEEVINMDTDIRDTTWLIRQIADEIEPIEESDEETTQKKKKNSTKSTTAPSIPSFPSLSN